MGVQGSHKGCPYVSGLFNEPYLEAAHRGERSQGHIDDRVGGRDEPRCRSAGQAQGMVWWGRPDG